MRYQFIEAHREEYPGSRLCETLEVSESGYYDWRKRPMSQHAQSDMQLAEQIRAIFQTHGKRYGSPRIHAELQERGMKCAEPSSRTPHARTGTGGAPASSPDQHDAK